MESSINALRRKSGEAEKRALAAEEALMVMEQEGPERRWLVSDSIKLHREASRAARQPAYAWKCGCGWAFGLGVGYKFVAPDLAINHQGSFCNGGRDLAAASQVGGDGG